MPFDQLLLSDTPLYKVAYNQLKLFTDVVTSPGIMGNKSKSYNFVIID